MWQDPIVAEIQQIREAYAAQFDFDLRSIYRALKEQEERSQRPKVAFPPRRVGVRQGVQPVARAPAVAG